MTKLPWIKLWFEDLDRDCGALSLSARGAWVWIIGDLHAKEGTRSLTLGGWSRVIRASNTQTATVLSEIINTGTCDSSVTQNVTRDALLQNSDAQITITCRRIKREYNNRKSHNLRQRRYRDKHTSDAQSDAGVTPIELEAEAIEAEAIEREKRKRRSRTVPEDFSISDEDRKWALSLRPDLNIDFETDKFKDYEFRDPKSDWKKTWKNWIRNARPTNGSKPKQKDILDLAIEAAEKEKDGSQSCSR